MNDMIWRRGAPPKDSKTYLVDIGMPWVFVCIYNAYDDSYEVADVQAEMIGPDKYSYYFESTWYKEHEIKAWMPLPLPEKGEVE